MKAELTEQNRTHTSLDQYPYFLEIKLIPETPVEGMKLAFIASRLRTEDIWCVINSDTDGSIIVSSRRGR